MIGCSKRTHPVTGPTRAGFWYMSGRSEGTGFCRRRDSKFGIRSEDLPGGQQNLPQKWKKKSEQMYQRPVRVGPVAGWVRAAF